MGLTHVTTLLSATFYGFNSSIKKKRKKNYSYLGLTISVPLTFIINNAIYQILANNLKSNVCIAG